MVVKNGRTYSWSVLVHLNAIDDVGIGVFKVPLLHSGMGGRVTIKHEKISRGIMVIKIEKDIFAFSALVVEVGTSRRSC